jgi:hypothetical protein
MSYINTYRSKFSFWGQRKYVHGSHMIYGLIDAADEWGIAPILNISAHFRTRLNKQGTYYLYNTKKDALADHKDFHSLFQIITRSGVYAVGLTSDNAREVTESIPDNESTIISGYQISKQGKRATLANYPKPLTVNAIIALNKKLLNELVRVQSWLMARFDLNLEECIRNIGDAISVQLVSNIGSLSARSSVSISDTQIGDIFFNKNPE